MDRNLIEIIIHMECMDVEFHICLTSLIFMLNIDVIQWVNDADICFIMKLNDVYMTYIDKNEISIIIIESTKLSSPELPIPLYTRLAEMIFIPEPFM